MTKMLLALGTAAVAMTASAPAAARPVCVQWRHGHCITYSRMGRQRMHRYRVGYVFGPDYGYTSYRALPRRYVTRYRLAPRYRYVYTNGYIYVVDPRTYAIVRVLSAL